MRLRSARSRRAGVEWCLLAAANDNIPDGHRPLYADVQFYPEVVGSSIRRMLPPGPHCEGGRAPSPGTVQ